MTWAMVLFYMLGAMGLTIIVSLSRVAAPFRKFFPSLLGCSLCTGFWAGCGAGAVLYLENHLPSLTSVFVFMCATALTSYIAGTWLREHDRPWPWQENTHE